MPTHRYNLNTTERLNFLAIPAWILSIAERLREKRYEVYLVGGAVRDLLWGRIPGDWDLATNALPEQVESVFPNTIPTGKQFGTITVIEEGNPVEITTFREDLGYSDGRRPDALRFGKDILKDLERRDFTINAMAYDFNTVELVDPFQGRRDLMRGILKTVGDPARRFSEDGLRMFRYYRFLATLDLKPDRFTAVAINPEWAKPVSMERIRDEFSKLILGKQVRIGLNGLKKSGLLQIFLPELQTEQLIYRGQFNRFDLWEHLLTAVETIQPVLHLRLSALLHDIAKPITEFQDEAGIHFYGHDEQGAVIGKVILERLRYSGKIIGPVCNLIRFHMFSLPPQAGDGAVRRLIAKVGPENIPDLLELRRADIVATGNVDYQTWENWQVQSQRILEFLKEKSIVTTSSLAVNGHDLVARFNLEPGPLIKELLQYLMDAVIEEPSLNQSETLLEIARKYLDSTNNY